MSARLLLGIALSALLLWLAVRHVDVDEFYAALAAMRPLPAAAAFAVTLVVCGLRSLRWRLLFAPIKVIPLGDLLAVIMIGFLGNNLLPARLGDVSMVYLIDRKAGVGKSRAVGVIFIDRLFDVTTLVGLLLVSLLIAPAAPWVRSVAASGIMVLLVAFLVVGTLATQPARCRRWVGAVLGRLLPVAPAERVLRVYERFVTGLSVVRAPVTLVGAGLLSVLIWCCLALGVQLLFVAFGFALGLDAAFAVLAIVNLGLIVPSSPGFVGTFQFFCVAALALYGIDKSAALGFSVAYHLSQWLPTTLLGFYFLNRDHLSMKRLIAPGTDAK